MNKLLDLIYNSNLLYIIRIIIAIICGFAIGFERDYKNKNAGTKTHGIVALGACLCMILSAYGFPNYQGDPNRMAAQVVSGIGFLGAGIIFVRRDKNISGLTTAAGIWTTAIISMAIGAGMILLGILCTLLVISLQWFLSKLKFKFFEHSEEIVYINTLNKDFDFEGFVNLLEDNNIEILHLETDKLNINETYMQLIVNLPYAFSKWDLNKLLMDFTGVKSTKI
ncbi:MgtC/SapB family protein [Miniphocaeibacter halophilus]|uniref:MgtC/SapB family protein n=1 Tax=Miniphocaeibacter halophilus TaxID=2931922 RepID=A0AC61N0A5_9FIRM|nr:MgtC/SapB family protein [Miniphocaeibacter halophilus]QQK08761.1 MgtC/SapB family protein [Miniphocaeibacter halophilus]